jgi:hypothetical protein
MVENTLPKKYFFGYDQECEDKVSQDDNNNDNGYSVMGLLIDERMGGAVTDG